MLIHLRAAGTSLVLDARGPQPPVVVHWGATLGDLDDSDLAVLVDATGPAVPPSSLDTPTRLSMLPGLAEGWSGRPAVSGAWAATGTARPQWRITGVTRPAEAAVLVRAGVHRRPAPGQHRDRAVAAGRPAGAAPDGEPGHRHLRARLAGRPAARAAPGGGDARLQRACGRTSAAPSGPRCATACGAGRPGTVGPGTTIPFLMMLGVPGFGFRSGEVWAVHLAWSGDKRLWAERQPLGHSLLGVRRAARARARSGWPPAAPTPRRGQSPPGRRTGSTASPPACTPGSGRDGRSPRGRCV